MSDDTPKREFPRATCEIRAEYRSAENFIESYMRQVSQGGLFIEQDDPAPMGAEIDLSFNLPGDSHLIKAKGKVVWRMINPKHDIFEKGVGVKFLEISDADRKKIGDYVKENSDH